MKKRKQENIAQVCVKAIRSSQEKYEKISSGYWLLNAPEYFLTTMISLKLSKKINNIYVLLEHSTSEALQDSKVIKSKKHKRLHRDIRAKGKVDIVIRNKNHYPKGVVEVKNNCWQNKEITKDFSRLSEILRLNKRKGGKIEFGIFTYYYSFFNGDKKDSIQKLENKNNTITKLISEVFDDSYEIKKYEYLSKPDEDGDIWGAFSLLIRMK